MGGGPLTLLGRGAARLSFPPPKRGVWRAEMTRDLDYSQILPAFNSGETLGLWVRRTCTGCVSPPGAPQRHPVFRLSRQSDRAGVMVPRRGYPSAARGRGWCRPRSREPHPAPTTWHLMMVALAGQRGRMLAQRTVQNKNI